MASFEASPSAQYVEKRSFTGRVTREYIPAPPQVQPKRTSSKEKGSSIVEIWRNTPTSAKKLGAKALLLTVSAGAFHGWVWSGDTVASEDNCTSPTQQQVVVTQPGEARMAIRRVYEAFGKDSPTKANGIYPTSVTGLVNTLQTQRSYVVNDAQFSSLNQRLKNASNEPLFSYDEDGTLRDTFENAGVYCVDVPAPVRSGSHLVTESHTSLTDISQSYRIPMETLMQLNPQAGSLDTDEALPEGSVIAVAEQQGNLVLQQADTEAISDYLTLPNGRFDKKQWQYISWENRAYNGITAIEPDDKLMFMPYDPTASKKLDGDTLPVADGTLFEQHDDISPESILAANPETPIGITRLKEVSRSGKRDSADERRVETNNDKESTTTENGGEKTVSVEHVKAMKADLVKLGVPEQFTKLYLDFGAEYGVSPFLLAAKDKHESNFDPNAVSPVGAKGLGQAMKGTWEWYQDIGVIPKDAKAEDPYYNVKANAWYVRYLLDKAEGSRLPGSKQALALAAYNAGPGTVFNEYLGIPPYKETRDYVARITGTLASWGKDASYYNDALVDYVEPADYTGVVKAPDNPVERRAYFAQKLGLRMGDIKFSSPNGLYQFDIDPKAAASKLDIPLYGNYPKEWRSKPLDALVDDWKMYSRECVSYTAWRVAHDDKPGDMPVWGGRDNQPDTPGHQSGDAYFWAGNAKAASIPVDKAPAVGSVAVWNREGVEHSWKGHAAYVEKVLTDGSIVVSQYNNGGTGDYTVEILSPQYLDLVDDQLSFVHFEKR